MATRANFSTSVSETGRISSAEAMRLLELNAGPLIELVMTIDNAGTFTEGESGRRYEGKQCIDIQGYELRAGSNGSHDGSGQRVGIAGAPLVVVRRSDAATGSLVSLLRSQAVLTVTVSSFRASGDGGSQQQRMFWMTFESARIDELALLTSSSTGAPCEILTFAYLRAEVTSAAQTATGDRGPLRTGGVLGY